MDTDKYSVLKSGEKSTHFSLIFCYRSFLFLQRYRSEKEKMKLYVEFHVENIFPVGTHCYGVFL